jgi:cell division protein DivIC
VTEKASGSRRRYKLWFLFMTVILAWAGYTLFSQMQAQAATRVRLGASEARLAEVRKTTQELQAKIKQLNDPEYISQLATKQQGLVKPGEQLFTPND